MFLTTKYVQIVKLEHLLCPKVGGGGTNPLVPPPTFESGEARAPPPSPTPLTDVEWFAAALCPLDLEKFQYVLVSAHYLHHKLTYWIEIRYTHVDVSWKYAVEVEFSFRWIIFGRVIPLWLRKIQIICGCHSLPLSCMNIFNWNSEYTCVSRNHRSSL